MSSNNSAGSKVRVYELARELGIEDSKSLINILRGMGYPVKTAANSIPDEAVQKVRETVTPHLEQLRREAQAKSKVEEEAQAAKASSKPTVRIARRATQEEKQALVERKAQRPEENNRARPVRNSNIKIRQTTGIFRRPGFGGIRPVRHSDAVMPKPENMEAAKAAIEETAATASTSVAEPVDAPLTAKALPISLPRPAPNPEPESKAAPSKEALRKRPAGKREEAEDEENDKEMVDLPVISAEEMGIKQDESVSLSTPTAISIEDAFGDIGSSSLSSAYEGGRGGRGEGRAPKARGGQPMAGRPGAPSHGGSMRDGMGRPGQGRRGAMGRGNMAGRGPGGRGNMGRNAQGRNQGRNQGRRAQASQPAQPPVQPQEKTIVIPEIISLADLAARMGRPANHLISTFVRQGKMVSINQPLSYEEARDLALSYGYKVGDMSSEDVPLELIEEDEGQLEPRPPVISVLGHVDHGKTSLLDAIRRTSVVDQEDGGITQKIGAYTVKHNGKLITFIDTPGHEAFTQMRARGAAITDIAILVVAANDGVMPQTVEAINHAKAANLPIIVAINKIDLPESNAERVMTQLTDYGLLAEEWGGDTVMCKVSAKRNIGLDDLLGMVTLQADLMELKANPQRKAQGAIIEGSIDKGKGPVATVLVQNGTLKVGDTVVVGKTWGRLRALLNEKGQNIRSACPSIPVEVIGLESVPDAGDHLQVVEDEKMARQVSEARTAKARHTRINTNTRQTLESLFADLQNGVAKDLNLLVKAESHGSMQALVQSLNKLSTSEVAVKIVHAGVGAISETDVMLASASNAIIIGYNVRPGAMVKRLADVEEVEIRTYRIIYEVIEHIRKAMSGLLTPDIEEVNLGKAEVRQVFKISKIGKVAGCYVTEGKIVRGGLARLVRDGVVIYESSIDTLRRFKDDAREVMEGFECGLTLNNYSDLQEGDVIECYQKVEHQREL